MEKQICPIETMPAASTASFFELTRLVNLTALDLGYPVLREQHRACRRGVPLVGFGKAEWVVSRDKLAGLSQEVSGVGSPKASFRRPRIKTKGKNCATMQ
jgi:hypothetical protein